MTGLLPNPPALLSGHQLFASSDLDEARAIVAGKFCDHQLDIQADKARFHASHHRVEGRKVSLNVISYGADVRIEPGALGSFYLVQIPIEGGAEIENGAGLIESDTRRGSILNPHRETRMRWRAGCRQLLLQIDAAALQRHAERMTGFSLNAQVSFDTAVDERNGAVSTWVNQLRACFLAADRHGLFTDQRQHTQAMVEDQLITGLLQAQPSEISELLARDRACGNPHVRRAKRVIRERLGEVLTLSDVAEAVGVTARSLQLGFRAETGQTPMQFLRRERLHYARHLLRHASDGDRVGDISLRAGFPHFGRFSTVYKEAFGESPSDTLRR